MEYTRDISISIYNISGAVSAFAVELIQFHSSLTEIVGKFCIFAKPEASSIGNRVDKARDTVL